MDVSLILPGNTISYVLCLMSLTQGPGSKPAGQRARERTGKGARALALRAREGEAQDGEQQGGGDQGDPRVQGKGEK